MANSPQFPFRDQGKEFVRLSNEYFDFSANIIIGDMVRVGDVQQLSVACILKSMCPFP